MNPSPRCSPTSAFSNPPPHRPSPSRPYRRLGFGFSKPGISFPAKALPFRLPAPPRHRICCSRTLYRYTIGSIAQILRDPSALKVEACLDHSIVEGEGDPPSPGGTGRNFIGIRVRRGTWHIQKASVCRSRFFFWLVSERLLQRRPCPQFLILKPGTLPHPSSPLASQATGAPQDSSRFPAASLRNPSLPRPQVLNPPPPTRVSTA